uniref:Zgc:162200 n=1 Tax=Eptatretus burgeri TaxID=7764 RepID=A0A8C4R5U8_EPTBU
MEAEEEERAGKGEAWLRAELERLARALSDASRDKVQAAEYGLAVLEEQQALQQRYEDLERAGDALRRENDALKEALGRVRWRCRHAAAVGESREEQLLAESATQEELLAGRIAGLGGELRRARAALGGAQADNDRLGTLSQQLSQRLEEMELQRSQLRDELKEWKARETRLALDVSELEEENISLQKQVSMLRQNQVEYETLKLDTRRLAEETEVLQAQLEEAERLEKISARQLAEALEAVAAEREQKNSLRADLSRYVAMHEASLGSQHTALMLTELSPLGVHATTVERPGCEEVKPINGYLEGSMEVEDETLDGDIIGNDIGLPSSSTRNCYRTDNGSETNGKFVEAQSDDLGFEVHLRNVVNGDAAVNGHSKVSDMTNLRNCCDHGDASMEVGDAGAEMQNHDISDTSDGSLKNGLSVSGFIYGQGSQPVPDMVADLLSELNGGTFQKMKQDLSKLQEERDALLSKLEGAEDELTSTRATLSDKQQILNKLIEQLKPLGFLLASKWCSAVGSAIRSDGDGLALSVDGEEVPQAHVKALVAAVFELRALGKGEGKECSVQAGDIWEQEKEEEPSEDAVEQLAQLKDDNEKQRKVIERLEDDLKKSQEATSGSQEALATAREQLVGFTEELAALSRHLCMNDIDAPNLENHSDAIPRPVLACTDASLPASVVDLRAEPLGVSALMTIVREQMRHLKEATERAAAVAAAAKRHSEVTGRSDEIAEREREGLAEEVLKLRSLLSTKREQIATLRTVLKANKQVLISKIAFS